MRSLSHVLQRTIASLQIITFNKIKLKSLIKLHNMITLMVSLLIFFFFKIERNKLLVVEPRISHGNVSSSCALSE